LLLLAARVTGRPVRMVWDRAESVRGHGKRHPFVIRHRLGANADGRLVAAVIDVLVDAGCYASTSAAVLDNAISQACGPYAIDDVLVTGRAVYTNNPYTCAMRGFGVNQMTFAMEQQVGKIACQLGLEAAVVRRRSFVPTAGRLANGTRVRAADGLPKTLAAVLSRAGRRALPRSIGTWRYGRGSASAAKNVGYSFGFDDRASAEVTRTRNGATVRIGAAECGQGVATVLVQIAAETLDLPPRRVRIEWQDTEEAPEAGSSSASRQTLVSGNAVRGACQAVRRAVDTRGGAAILPQGGITRRYTFRAPRTGEIGARRSAPHAYAYGWASCAAEVRVDIATGCVEVLRIVSAVDAGRVVNRRLFEGQVEGGAVMGQGYALQERFLLRDGMPVSLGFEGCAVPTVLDAAPQIDTIAVECAEPIGPFGARGVGEITMIPVVPAITAAIRDAVGVWIDEIPASPERVRLALASARKSGAGPAPRRRRLRR
jgi:CO/xanthine dehydrogenase Mo-binding subunit